MFIKEEDVMEELFRSALENDQLPLYVFGFVFLGGCARALLSEVFPGTAYYESRRRYDYCEQYGQTGRLGLDNRGRDHYTAMMRKKNPRWMSKLPQNNKPRMFDDGVEQKRAD